MRYILALLITSLACIALAEEQQAPFWLAKVKVKCDDMVYNCLGAIVEDNFIITTASCVNKCDDSVRVIRILVTDYSTNGSKLFGEKVRATKVTIHPEYSLSETEKIHDVALVKFRCPDFQLAEVSLNDSCSRDIDLSVIDFNQTTGAYSAYEASIANRKRKCKQAYKNWDDSQQVCVMASLCSDKSGSLITDDQHKVLFSFPIYASSCDNNKNTIIAAMELCKYHEWITSMTTAEARCTKKPPTTPRQITTTQPTTTAATTATAAPTTAKPSGCSTPASIENGDVTYTSLSLGSIAKYSCDRGYVMKGSKRLKCLRSGWNKDPPTCNPVSQCNNPPRPLKMNVDIPESLTEGAKARYSCPGRYKLVGDNVLICKSGNWAGDVPYCKDCPEFGAVSNGLVRVILNITIHLSVEIKCNTGYRLKGDYLNNCDKGKWRNPKATCEATKCPIPKSIPNGSVRTTGLTYASLAQYKCDNGYVLSGFKQRQCKSDGAWTGTPPECLQQNRVFCVSYGRITCGTTANSGGVTIGATVTYTPNSNAQLVGASKITCMPNGSWSAPTPMCRLMCEMSFDLENGDYKLIMKDDTPDYEMEMNCDDGYEMAGIKLFTCKNGFWNRTPSETKCRRPCICPQVRNGGATCYDNFGYRFVNVKCNSGFTMKGTNPGVCQGGAYVVPTPTCV